MNSDDDIRDTTLDALLDGHATETPPAHVDAAILAAAHRAVAAAPHAASARATQAWRWWMPLAAAAVIGAIVVAIMPLAPTLRDETSAIVSDAPLTAPREATRSGSAAVAPPSQPLPAATTPPEAPARDGSSVSNQITRQAASSKPAPVPDVRRPTRNAPASMPDAGRATTKAPAPTSDVRSAATRREKHADPAQRNDVAWITQIRDLRTQGKVFEAAQALARFREAFSDADERLPPDLRTWAASAPPVKH